MWVTHKVDCLEDCFTRIRELRIGDKCDRPWMETPSGDFVLMRTDDVD